MAHGIEFEAFDREFAEFSDRITALRTARENSPDLADALLVELELAGEELRVCRDELTEQVRETSDRNGAAHRERTLLRAVFGELPVPVFVLDHGGTVRRANRAAAELLGTSSSYIVGKPFPVFVDLTARAAFRSRLSAVLRTGAPASFASVVVPSGQRLRARLMLSRLDPATEARPLVVATILPSAGVAAKPAAPPNELPAAAEQAADGPSGPEDGSRPAASAARRLDLMSQVTRLLLDDPSLSEAVTLQRVAALLLGQAADWVIVDLARDGELTRAVVAGPGSAGSDPPGHPIPVLAGRPGADAAFLPGQVLETGQSVLHPVILDEHALGATADGRPVLTALQAGSVLSVPLRTGCGAIGVLTLVRSPEQPAFSLADLRVFEDIGEHLALALRTGIRPPA